MKSPHVTRQRPAGTRLTYRDYIVIEAAHLYRGLSPAEAASLFFTCERVARRRLLLLHQAGYLDRVQTPLHSGIGRAPFRYVPSNEGRRVIAERRECGVQDVRPMRDEPTTAHTRTIRDV